MANRSQVVVPNYEVFIAKCMFTLCLFITTFGVGLQVFEITNTYYWAIGFTVLSWNFFTLLGMDYLVALVESMVNSKIYKSLVKPNHRFLVGLTEYITLLFGTLIFSQFFSGVAYLLFQTVQTFAKLLLS